MLAGDPILPQQLQGALWERDIAVFLPLAAPDMHQHPGAVQVRDLEPCPFADTQATGVDGRQTAPIVRQTDGLPPPRHLIGGEHIRQGLSLLGTNQVQNPPLLVHGPREEGLDGAEGLRDD